MIHTALRNFYEKRKSLFTESLKVTNRNINIVSNIRLGAALIFLALIYIGYSDHSWLYALPPVLLMFILLVRKHSSLFEEKTRLENLKKIQHQEMQALNGDFSDNDSGSEFINVHHPYSHDLDIFGEGSLFQYINRSSTGGGKRLLSSWLSSKPKELNEIGSRQEAVRELAQKTDLRHEIQALGMQIHEQENDERQLDQWLSQPSFIFGKAPYQVILNVFPPVTVGLVLAAIFVDGMTPFAVLAALLQWIFLGFHMKRVNAFHVYISRKKNALEKYARILVAIRKETYASPLMQSLSANAEEAGKKVTQLSSLVSAFDARLNSMTNLFVNSLLLYDLQCVYRLERWKEQNSTRLPVWLAAIRHAEAICSLGTFSFNHPNFAFPVVNTGQKLTAKDLGHPLIDEKDRVANNMYLDAEQSIMIITGANMAGKSTFLRSLGVNVVLALTGAPVCAAEFHCPLIDVRSGMRTADSLKENQSYFYAELDRLKSIMDDLRHGTPLLILLDEILKGTNSTDKQAGSVALVRQLVDYPCLVLIATHDLALGDLEKSYQRKIANYCFEATIENEQLSFDYKLKRGLAQKMNATFLMRKMGIIV